MSTPDDAKMINEKFADKAESLLRKSATQVLRDFLANPQAGKWHPNGFAVFHMAHFAGLGQMRLHVWAPGKRVALEGQPAIHSHPWAVSSLVVGGRYVDTLYKAVAFNEEGPGRLQGYGLEIGPPEKGDELQLNGNWYEVSVLAERAFAIGEVHTIPSGVLHEVKVPLDGFAATLLVTSDDVDRAKLLLLGDGDFDKVRYVRPNVSPDDLEDMRLELAEAMAAGS
jgi:hypothetical protein